MATTQHSRTRSTRLATTSSAATTRPLSTHGKIPSQLQKNPHDATKAPNAAAMVSSTSAISLFLTNLRLLNLDLLPDWPNISATTFAAAGHGAQGQKHRVQCTEWALFRLFEIWDPEDTANKLKPFFPSNDQLQSVNLRSALLRALEAAKKSGALGRDAVIRKTMLDECKGERLEDLLATFSSAVLKKAVADEVAAGAEYPSIAVKLALENFGYQGDNSTLRALILAYRASLTRTLERKNADAAKYRDFMELLAVKERGLVRRSEAVQAFATEKHAKDGLTRNEKDEVLETVRNNWTGSEAWMEALLSGDTTSKNRKDLLSVPFERVWRRVQQGRLAELEDGRRGLLEQLDSRIKVQNDRLARWDSFRKPTAATPSSASPLKKRGVEAKKRGIDLNFEAHKDLQVHGLARVLLPPTNHEFELDDEYIQIIQDLKEELSEPVQVEPKEFIDALLENRRRQSYLAVPDDDTHQEDSISELSDIEGDFMADFRPTSSFETNMKSAKRLPHRPQAPPESQHTPHINSTQYKNGKSGPQRDAFVDQELYKTKSVGLHKSTAFEARPVRPQPLDRASSNEKMELRDQKSTSPPKPSKPRYTLSLAERTRLSMARASTNFLAEEDVDLAPTVTAKSSASAVRDNIVQEEEDDDISDLASRTRKSMAGFERAQNKAQLDRRRSIRKSKVLPKREGSLFPPVDEEQDQDALIEKLMAEDNMDAIFQSRPKIRASPIPSPTAEWDDDDDYE